MKTKTYFYLIPTFSTLSTHTELPRGHGGFELRLTKNGNTKIKVEEKSEEDNSCITASGEVYYQKYLYEVTMQKEKQLQELHQKYCLALFQKQDIGPDKLKFEYPLLVPELKTISEEETHYLDTSILFDSQSTQQLHLKVIASRLQLNQEELDKLLEEQMMKSKLDSNGESKMTVTDILSTQNSSFFDKSINNTKFRRSKNYDNVSASTASKFERNRLQVPTKKSIKDISYFEQEKENIQQCIKLIKHLTINQTSSIKKNDLSPTKKEYLSPTKRPGYRMRRSKLIARSFHNQMAVIDEQHARTFRSSVTSLAFWGCLCLQLLILLNLMFPTVRV